LETNLIMKKLILLACQIALTASTFLLGGCVTVHRDEPAATTTTTTTTRASVLAPTSTTVQRTTTY
jgi:hypothetical protein